VYGTVPVYIRVEVCLLDTSTRAALSWPHVNVCGYYYYFTVTSCFLRGDARLFLLLLPLLLLPLPGRALLMDDFDDIFGEFSASSPGGGGEMTPGDDDIDALFGLSSPGADADSVREAMEAERRSKASSSSSSSSSSFAAAAAAAPSLTVGTPATPLGALDESFSDIFGDSPTNNISSDIIAAFQSANAGRGHLRRARGGDPHLAEPRVA
jgi:hypothetical protein